MDKAEKVFEKLARSYAPVPGQVQNNYMAYQDPAKVKHQAQQSGRAVENNKMSVEKRKEDKHARKPDADQKKEAAVQNLSQSWLNG